MSPSQSWGTLTADGAVANDVSGTSPVGYSGETFAADTFALSEPGPAGYDASAWSCVRATVRRSRGSSITLGLADKATCTITNNDIQPTLKLIKYVVNDNGGTAQVSDFPLFISGTAATSGTAYGKNAGNYTASETSKYGYTASAWGGDCAANGSVTLAVGDNKTCTITNNDQPGTIIVKKLIKPEGAL